MGAGIIIIVYDYTLRDWSGGVRLMLREHKTRVLFGGAIITVFHDDLEVAEADTSINHFKALKGEAHKAIAWVARLKRPIMYRRDVDGEPDGKYEDMDMFRFCVRLHNDVRELTQKEKTKGF